MDILGLLQGQIESLLKQAKEAEAAGQWAKATSLYQKAAVLQRQYADRLAGPDSKKTARERADAWEHYGQVLLVNPPRPRFPGQAPGSPGGPAAEATSHGGEEPGLQALVDSLVVTTSNVKWDDIAGLEDVKREVKMAFALNFVLRPTSASGQPIDLPPWRRILLYGPPGTGKTMLAAAIAGQIPGATFFDANWSRLASKWFGESERIVQLLYQTARERSPSVVFLDEVDAIASDRDSGSESGASKKVLSSLLTALDGIQDKIDSPFVLSFVATNRPWALDAAFFSRFAKAIYVPLPDAPARLAILRLNLQKKGYQVQAEDADLAARTEGYSGRDLSTLCKQIIVDMVYQQNPDLLILVDQGVDALKGSRLKLRAITMADVERAMQQIRPSVSRADVALYQAWRNQMGY